MTATTPADALLRAYSESIRKLAGDAGRCVRRWLPDAVENVDQSARVISYRHGPGDKGMVCTLIPAQTGVKLGLVGGAALADPGACSEGAARYIGTCSCRSRRNFGGPG